ncbi:nucleoid occlusion factor SlmA [Hahella sp. SMD15-11]|uniref:Nucleoid occlusion factor SlmA n=1 Tax=Thermohahella caldifontis TaxID=3142973 RepID=A0AB39UW76_9GAMM
MKKDRHNRKAQILQALAQMLENEVGGKITTARLAAEVGVSEAALYRHFPSKGKMFEGLIEFIEETLISRMKAIRDGKARLLEQTDAVIVLWLTFAQKNPGMCRVMMGDALVGEHGRLRQRVAQLFARLETELRTWVRDAEIRDGERLCVPEAAFANFVVAMIEGQIHALVRHAYDYNALQYWEDQRHVLSAFLANRLEELPALN